jgi:aromatic-L-amino-acid decarboxylase
MADYLEGVGREPVVSSVEPGQIRAALPAEPPSQPESFRTIRGDFDRIIYPGITHWGHPGFFGYFPANASPPSILAEMMIAAMGVNCMSWLTSPAGTELEQVTLDWLRQMVGLPPGFTGVIQDYASTSTLVALITARDRHRGGLDRATVYLSAEAHSSVAKGARLAGYRPELIRVIAVDDRFAMRPDTLRDTIAADLATGLVPSAIVATLGTTSSTGFDPVVELAGIARETGCWLHVDAAFAGAAAIVPELRWIMAGVDRADSVVINPHKWLLVHHDCSAYYVRDPGALVRSFSTAPEYLKTKHDSAVVNFRDWGIPLGRRFRSLKLWFVIRSYGVEGLQAMIREHVRLGLLVARWVEQDPAFELAAPALVGLVCFRLRGRGDLTEDNELNRRFHERINASGEFYLTHTLLNGRYTIRLALGHLSTTEELITRLWDRVQGAAHGLALS